MGKAKLRQYKGELSAEQIAHGINVARRNSRRLADDAKLLLDAGRYPTAASVAVLSIEEQGKVTILRGLAFSPNEQVRLREWKDFRLHRSKNTMWILPELVAKGARNLDSLRLAADPTSEHTALLEHLKQLGFYTDCLGDANWSDPENVIDENLARSLVGIADLLATSEMVTVKEIALWIEHMRPAYGAPLELMKTALLNWYAAMCENGLWEDNSDVPVESFVRGRRTANQSAD